MQQLQQQVESLELEKDCSAAQVQALTEYISGACRSSHSTSSRDCTAKQVTGIAVHACIHPTLNASSEGSFPSRLPSRVCQSCVG